MKRGVYAIRVLIHAGQRRESDPLNLQIGGADARSVQKTPAGTVRNVHPCTFRTYVFAKQTRYRLEPPPSVDVLKYPSA